MFVVFWLTQILKTNCSKFLSLVSVCNVCIFLWLPSRLSACISAVWIWWCECLHVWGCVPTVSQCPVLFNLLLFSSSFSAWVISTELASSSLILSSAMLTLMINPSKASLFLYCNFCFQLLIQLIFSISLLKLQVYSCMSSTFRLVHISIKILIVVTFNSSYLWHLDDCWFFCC